MGESPIEAASQGPHWAVRPVSADVWAGRLTDGRANDVGSNQQHPCSPIAIARASFRQLVILRHGVEGSAAALYLLPRTYTTLSACALYRFATSVAYNGGTVKEATAHLETARVLDSGHTRQCGAAQRRGCPNANCRLARASTGTVTFRRVFAGSDSGCLLSSRFADS